jgi:hypothetical protein
MPGTLDRVVTCVAAQLIQATACTADRVSEPAAIPAESVNSAYLRDIAESRVTWPSVAAAPLRPASCEQRQPPRLLRGSTTTETRHKGGPAWADFSDDLLESVEPVRTAAIEGSCRAG